MTIPTVKLVWNDVEQRHEESGTHHSGARFLQLGRIPTTWLEKAANLPGKALAVGISIWSLAIAVKTTTVMVTPDNVKGFGVDASAKARAITALRDAGLITVERRKGRFPIVTLVGANEASEAR